MKTKSRILLLVCLGVALTGMLAVGSTSLAQEKKVDVVNMTTPFGTPMYNAGVALEKVFEQHSNLVNMRLQATPGAMYIMRYVYENNEKIARGEMPQVVASTSAATFGFVIEGRPPFTGIANPTARGLFSSPSFVTLMVTFNPNIKTMADLEGKRVGIAEKSRPFQSQLALRPYFEKGLGIWDKVNWEYLGAVNSKEALLNNRIDVHYATFWGKVEMSADGTYICTEIAPDPPTLELMSSGRKLYIIEFDPDIITKSHDFATDMVALPVRIQKGAHEFFDRDFYGRLTTGVYQGDESMPYEVLKEIIRVRHQYREELGTFHATLKMFPANPYPVGLPKEWVHSGVERAMKELGIPLPGQQ